VHGNFKGDVAVEGSNLIVNGRKIRLTAVKDPAELKWNEIGADLVIDSTGLFLTKEGCQKHHCCRRQEGRAVGAVKG
jgi:glyceraldehyde 3-phosphate dehydrogenase